MCAKNFSISVAFCSISSCPWMKGVDNKPMKTKSIILLVAVVACAFCAGFSAGMHLEHLAKIETSWQNDALSQALFYIERLYGGNSFDEAMSRLRAYNRAALSDNNLHSFSTLTRNFVFELVAIEQNQQTKKTESP